MTISNRYDRISVLNPSHVEYLQELLMQMKANPQNVDSMWREYLQGLEEDLGSGANTMTEIKLFPARQKGISYIPVSSNLNEAVKSFNMNSNADSKTTLLSLRALMMIRAFRVRGHLGATLDPLKLEKPKYHVELDPERYGFNENTLEQEVILDGVLGFEKAHVKTIYKKLVDIYCGNVGFEFMHIQDAEQKSWLQERIESGLTDLTKDEKLLALLAVMRAESFERFLQIKFPGAKRFGVEGGESVLACLEFILNIQAQEHGVKELCFGMAHRGRLCVLTQFLTAPLDELFAQFKGYSLHESISESFSGDVKYHNGFECVRQIHDQSIKLTLLPNPSHLEAVNPVVIGYVRARQNEIKDSNRSLVSGVLIHGDSAFAGQGLVAETLELSALDGYETGGTIHIIINNQIGFTTSPPMSRSSPYASDLAKVIQAPVFHVNGDDLEAVVAITKLAVQFKHQFKRDVVIDLVCYRRNGHNEGDEPMFTQPIMYKVIDKHPSVSLQYQKKLNDVNVLKEEQVTLIQEQLSKNLNNFYESSERFKDIYMQIRPADVALVNPITGFSLDNVVNALQKAHQIPEGFELNAKLQRLMTQRQNMLVGEQLFDWAMGEIFAFSSLLMKGIDVRLSGQDSGRGTFSHRHAVWVDQNSQKEYIPLNHLSSDQGMFEVVDSPLAEASVLGFEYGYSINTKPTLVLWEAQFGDFANGAQVIIDQFICSAEAKWKQHSNLVLLLPHGFEGQGPEHSSARLERYLQLSAQYNWRIVNCTTPANLFHVLRRQVISKDKKPLIVMTPKSLLRHKEAVSMKAEIQEGTSFKPFISDDHDILVSAKRHVFCSGKVYYDLIQKRAEWLSEDMRSCVAIHRLEELHPFPYEAVQDVMSKNVAADIVWCQEEPENMGAWRFVREYFEEIRRNILGESARYDQVKMIYAGRKAAASPATGHSKQHTVEQEIFLRQALLNDDKT